MGDVVRVVKRGRFVGYYICYIDIDGRRKQRASHQPTLEAARRLLLEVEARIARQQVGIPEPAPRAPTLGELIERFLREYRRPRIKNAEAYRQRTGSGLRRFLPRLGKRYADAITMVELAQVRDELLARLRPGTVRLSMSQLKTVYSWAVKHQLVEKNPLKLVELPRAEPDGFDYLGREEIARLLDACEGMLRIAVLLALHVGLRKGELFGLRWRDLDLETRRLTIAKSFATSPKSGKTRHLRLPRALVPLLGEWRVQCPVTPDGLVFPVAGKLAAAGELLALPAAMARAGLRAFARPWHALRHTFASHFIMQGGNILTLQKILGHADLRITLMYAHLAPDFLGDELDRLKLI